MITLSCGGSTIELTPGKIDITSPMVNINGNSMTTINGGVVKINS
jgi:hypothetical protein